MFKFNTITPTYNNGVTDKNNATRTYNYAVKEGGVVETVNDVKTTKNITKNEFDKNYLQPRGLQITEGIFDAALVQFSNLHNDNIKKELQPLSDLELDYIVKQLGLHSKPETRLKQMQRIRTVLTKYI